MSGAIPSATAAALPPEEPPEVRVGSHGLPVTPVRGASVTPFQPNSGVVVLPTSTPPCSRTRATEGASTSQGPAASIECEPRSVGQPRVSSRSLIDTGTPSSTPQARRGPSGPRTARADASAAASSTRQNALTRGSSRAMRASTALVASTGDSVRAR